MEKTKKTTAFSSVKKNIIRAVGLMLCAVLIVLAVPSANDAVSAAKVSDSKSKDMEAQIAALNQQIEQIKNNISTTSNNIDAAIKEKERLDTQLNLQMKKIELTNELIAELSGNIEQKDTEIADSEASYQEKYALFKTRLRAAHEEGHTSYLEMLLGAKSLSDFLSRVDRIGAMLAYDTKIMEELKSEKASLESARNDFSTKKQAQEEYLAQLKEDEAELEKLKTESATYLSKLQSNKAYYAALYEKQLAAEEQLQEELQEYLAELERKQNSKFVGGTFMWPVPLSYTRVSSPYGWRNSPLTGKPELHNGIDIPAAGGTNIYASNTGTVTIATYHWSYGNYIMIDHGGGYATLYAHCSKLLVSSGQKVNKGDVIAQVGSTGSSTGNHLHFSLYESSKHTDPMKFFGG